MVLWSYPPTAKQLAVTIGICLTGASFIAAGAYLSFVNIGPQQERVKARDQALPAPSNSLVIAFDVPPCITDIKCDTAERALSGAEELRGRTEYRKKSFFPSHTLVSCRNDLSEVCDLPVPYGMQKRFQRRKRYIGRKEMVMVF
ncbi:hypothetical protein Godav_028706 [Gossypium davidsonii]|uniref:Uncharacterized protein n=1 Tax=Gossypium davidsonii TaxID=34287 RepID=A0A7J8S176_GOSDV|nr:hypothetical protein [Gossypium davidsonii]